MVKVFVGVLIVTFVVVIGFMIVDPEIPNTNTNAITEVYNDPSVKFSIEGEVYKAGTYTLKDNATMYDLIEAAGGLTAIADERSYFDSATLSKGQTYYIGALYDANDVCNNKEISKVNINNDDATTLASVNGITSSIANSIVSWRVENGTFETIEDLLDVYGIGTATYRKIRNYVILHE